MSAVRDSSGLSTLAGASVRDATNALATIGAIMVRDANGIYPVLSSASLVSVSPSEVAGFGYSKTPVYVSTDIATVSAPSGATYHWTPPTGWTASNPNAASSSFSAIVGADASQSADIPCTVTVSGKVYTVNVSAYVENNYAGS